MASRIESGESEVYRWLSSISQGLNLQRLAPEFERRGFRAKHSLTYMAQNDLDIIINSPEEMLLAERRILEKELEGIKKPPLQPKELFPSPYTGPFQVVNSAVEVGSLAPSVPCSNVAADVAGTSHDEGHSIEYPHPRVDEFSQNLPPKKNNSTCESACAYS